MPKFTELGALKIVNPEAWKMEIQRAMGECKGRIPDAAEVLGVSSRQLFRWLALDELRDIPRVPVGLPKSGRRGRKPKKPGEASKPRKKHSDPDLLVLPSGKKVKVTEGGIKHIPSRSHKKRGMVK